MSLLPWTTLHSDSEQEQWGKCEIKREKWKEKHQIKVKRFKGTVSRDFLDSIFFINLLHLVLLEVP
jgi:hypothetical protein